MLSRTLLRQSRLMNTARYSMMKTQPRLFSQNTKDVSLINDDPATMGEVTSDKVSASDISDVLKVNFTEEFDQGLTEE